MLTSSAAFAAIAVVGVGFAILWSNPARWVNRVVFSTSIHIAIWLAALFLTISASSQNGLYWLRWTTAIAALIPFQFWLVKEALASDFQELTRSRAWRPVLWLVVTAALSGICFTGYFIPHESTHERRLHGIGYYIYIIGSLGLYIALAIDSLQRIRTLIGGRRLTLQVWLGGGCAAAAAILVLMALNAVTHDPQYIRIQPLVVLGFYAATTYAITTHRIFDARQLVLFASGKSLVIVVVAFAAFVLNDLAKQVFPYSLAFLITTALALWFSSALSSLFDRYLQFYPQGTSARLAAFSAAQRESRVETLESSFRKILSGWGQSDRALILSGSKGHLSGGGVTLVESGTVVAGMRQLRWATPERLARERRTNERSDISAFLAEHELGAAVISEGPSLTVLIGVGVAASRRPYTYPQITQLLELASIMESALERAHFSAKVQHAEQLATVGLLGASLAHEIRNPLVSIKTFVQLLPTHHQDPAFREKFFRLIGEEVGRIDGLTEQLLDLASPRTYSAEIIELHPVLRASMDLVAAKAAHRNVEFMTDFQAAPDRAYTDASAAKQVMLNLCFNAIQAVEQQESEARWVKIATRNTARGLEMAVADSGKGIAEEIRARLFQPFQTTKSTGFGLGLAICSDILANLNASISVDPPVPGQGATFRVTFPCQPSSS